MTRHSTRLRAHRRHGRDQSKCRSATPVAQSTCRCGLVIQPLEEKKKKQKDEQQCSLRHTMGYQCIGIWASAPGPLTQPLTPSTKPQDPLRNPFQQVASTSCPQVRFTALGRRNTRRGHCPAAVHSVLKQLFHTKTQQWHSEFHQLALIQPSSEI